MERKACAVSCVALMLALVWARISAGSIFLTVNEEDVGFIWLPSGGSCTIEVVSDDSSFYSAYLDYSLVQGDFWHVETRPEAGEYASAGDLGDAYELVASGLTPPPSAGIHFVFQYYGSLAPVEDELTLWDDSYAVILDTVEIFVGSGPPEDIDPPTPDPMTWSSTPRALNSSQITMTATTAWDPCGVEYYFDCNCWGGHDSGWQEESVYTDTSLQPGTEYSYRVKARDQSANQNETAWSGAASAATANDIYVDDNAPNDPGSGDPCVSDPLEDGSLEHPFDAIQEAINGASNGDTVIVLPGTYTGTGNRAIDFWGKAITVRGQTGAEDCVVDCQWAARGFYFHLGEEANSVVEGLTITNGYADPGGAIYCGSSSPTIVNCRLVDNEAGSPGGGGIYCVYSNAAISRCSFSGNRTDYNGGGLFSRYGHPTVINCAFSGNYAGMSGGGINNYQAADPPTSPLFENCLFYENIADDYGGGLCNRYSEPNIVGCIFLDNAASAGGGIEIVYADSIRLANCTFGGNAVALNGGAVDVYTSCVTLANCTIADNWANVYGGAIVCSSYNSVSSLTVNNCILWGNTAGTNGAQIALRDGQMYSTMTVSYSDVEGGQPGAYVEPNSTLVWDVGNIDVDPCFFKGYDSDYHLRAESLCINAGDPNGYYGGQTDIDGEPRKMGSEVDMGSDEVFATAPGLLVWYRFEDYQWPIVAENSGSFGSRGTGYLMPDCPNCPAWVWPGYSSSYALQFDGIDDYVEIPALNLNTNTMTISAWVKGDGPQAAYTGIVSSRDQTTSDGTGLAYGSSGQAGGWQANQELCYYWNDDYRQWRSGLYIPADEWAFVGFAVEPSRATLYLDDGTFYCATNVASHGRLEQFDSGSLSQIAHDDMHEHFQGLIDDVRIYNRALSAEEVASIAGADLTRAWDPSPASGAMGAAADTVLTWRPGLWAADTNGHDVYFGLNGWLVNSRDPSAYIGRLDANSFDPPGGLELGLTYYWAVDEVNDSHPNSPWQGPTWSFTVHNIYYVDVNAWGTNDGSSWTDAFGDLQDALDVAQEGDQIRVAEGIYRPSERTDPCYPRTATFQLIDGVATYGGFPSRGSNWDGRDPDSYETILSGDLDGNDVEVLDPCDLLNESTRAENAYHVVTGIGAGATTVLDGFTITGGNANGPFPHYNGAGMTCAVVINYEFASGGSPTVSNCRFTEGSASHDGGGISYCGGSIANCTFTHNFADDDGGALHFCSGPVVDCNISGNAAYHCGGGLYKCSGSLTDSVITGNYSGGWGGGIYNSYEGGYELITDCLISENSATYGGGVYNDACSPTMTKCTLTANNAAEGGGLLNYANAAAVVTNCTFKRNAAGAGGAIFNEDSEAALFANCAFSGNLASFNGGAICNLGSSPKLINCAFSGNAANNGGGMYNLSSTPTVTNCTFSGNDAAADGGGVYSDPNTMPVIDNSVFWGNTDTGDGAEAAQISGPASINYSCVQGWTGSLGGTGNIGEDPNFVRDPDDGGDGWDGGNNDDYGDLRLMAGSACIDSADNNSVPPDTADLDGDGNTTEPTSRDLIGHLRFIDDPNTVDTGSGASPIVDMGAYEFILEIHVDDDAIYDPGPGDPDVSDPNEDGSSGHPFDSIQEAIDVSVDGDTIVVLPGTYIRTGNRDIDFGGRAITLRSTRPNDPIVVEATLIDCEGSSEDPHRGFYFHSGEDANSVLKGLSITNGYQTQGGAIACETSSPAIGNCTFYANHAQDGGAMFNSNSSPAVTNCTFRENVAVGRGGAIYNPNSRALLACCTFVGNSASAGAGVFNQGPGNSPAVVSCVFSGNSADNGGGGIFNYTCNPLVANCTFRGNFAGTEGGAIHNFQSNPALTNCILWANADSGPAGLSAQIDGSGAPSLSYCCLQGWTASSGGTGNIGTDPLLTPDDHLSGGSPCINSGDPARDYGGQVDIDGESRVMNGRVDIGADEYSDTDVDGLSDFWELTHFGSLSADPNADPDGDGLPSIDEFGIYGSNPNAPPIRVPQELDTIQAGIDVADEGDTVLVAAGTYAGAGNTDLDFGGKAVVLYGPNGPAMTIIDCNDSARGFDFHSGETSATAVLGFTITRGFGDYGGAVRCDHSHPQIRECVFTDNTATSQGHNIYCVMSTPTLAGCSISSGAAASVADIWMQYGGARILGLIQIFDCNWVGSKLTLTGDGTVQMGPGAELNLDESLVFCNFVGPVNVQVGIGSELTIDGDAVIDLADPCDPNVRGTIDCNGLLLVKDNVQITNANINVMRARFEGHTSFTNNVITIDRWAPPGQFFIESDVTITYNDIYVNGDRYTELDPILFQGAFQHNRIFVTITEGVGTAQGGLFELRGEDGRADNNCPPEQYMCQVDPCTIPECNLATWTIEQMTFIPQAKLNLTNRFPFQAPFEPGSDYDVLYVKKLILGEESVLNTAYNRVYYETLEAGPNAVIKHVPLLGFSLINIAFDEVIEFIVRVTHNNFTHPADPNYNRTHIRRIEGLEPDPNGMMEMLNITVWDPNSPYCGQVVNARAKGVFAKAAEDQILVRFEYMFIEDPCDEAELVVYLSDKPELGENLVELARVRPSAPGRHGSVGSQDMAIFSGTFSGGDLNFVRGTYIELELCGTGARLWIDDWDPVIECYKPKCGDYGPDFGTINIIDYLLLVSEVGLSSPSSADKGCLDLICDGVVNNDDLLVWDVVERLHKCPMVEGAAATVGAAAGKPLGFDLEVPGADESASLVVLGKPQRSDVNDSNTPENCLYRMDANGACLGDSAVAAGNSRLVTDGLGNIYQIRNSIGIVRQDGTVVVEPGYVNDGNNVVVVGYCDIDGDYEEDGPLLSDAAFGACDPNIVYVVPVRVIPPEAEGCPYVAAAKLELTGGGNYNLLKLYGLNPVADPNQSRIPDCETVGSFVYEPDVQHLHEVEIDSYGNLFVLSFVICSDANNGNDNNWLLIYDEAAGNDSEVRVLLSDPGIGDPNLTAPTAMVVSSLEDKVYLASSARATDAEPNDLTAEVYRFSINRTGRLATGLTYDGRVDVICPEPNASVCSQYEGLCYENSAISTITSMVENPEDANLYVTGFTSPKFTELQWQSSQIEGFFTTPMLAVVTPDGNGPVHAVEISNCDPNGPLVLPLSVVWAGERHGGADLSHDGNVDMKDFSMLAQYWLASYCAGPDWCGGADLEPEDQPDGDVEMADLAVLVRHWLEIECAD